jgi:hypothetical protein
MTKKRIPLEQLRRLISPPGEPADAGPITLRKSVERTLGLALPDDLYELALNYGTGGFGTATYTGILRVYNPFSPMFVRHVSNMLATLRVLKEGEGDSYIPYGIHPEKPGLFPFGQDDNERLILWLTEGGPNEWPILVWTPDPERTFERNDERLIEFIVRVRPVNRVLDGCGPRPQKGGQYPGRGESGSSAMRRISQQVAVDCSPIAEE